MDSAFLWDGRVMLTSVDSEHAHVAKENTTSGQFRLIDLIDDLCTGRDVFFRFVRVAKDIMTDDIKTLTLDETVAAALLFMKNNKVRHIPVMDPPTDEGQKPYFVGVVSQRDVFRQISPYVGKIGQEEGDVKALRKRLGQIVSRKPKCVSPETPVENILRSLLENHIDVLPVLANKELVGIITSEDIVRFFVRLGAVRELCTGAAKKTRLVDLFSEGGGDWVSLLSTVVQTVGDIMTEEVVCLGPEDSLADAMQAMHKGRFRHVPVADEAGKLVGILSNRDVLLNLPFSSGQQPSSTSGLQNRLAASNSEDSRLTAPLKRFMKREIIHVSPSCNIFEAAKKLHQKGVSCLPVLDEGRAIRGILTVTNLMRALLAVYELIERGRDHS